MQSPRTWINFKSKSGNNIVCLCFDFLKINRHSCQNSPRKMMNKKAELLDKRFEVLELILGFAVMAYFILQVLILYD